METGEKIQTSTAPAARKRSRILLVFAALFLGLLLLSAWFTPKALAQDAVNAFDLAISKSSIPEYFSSANSQNNKYIITVSRTNTETVADAIYVRDQLPSGLSIDTWTADGWNCSLSFVSTRIDCFYSDPVNLLMSLPPIVLNVFVTDTISGDIVTNTVELLVDDGNPANNIDSLTTLIDPIDLEISKTYEPEIVGLLDTIFYTVVITNNTSTPAEDIVVVDTLSSYIDLDSIKITKEGLPEIFTNTIGTTKVQWEIPLLAGGDHITYTIEAKLLSTADGKTVTNFVEVNSPSQVDLNPDNNSTSTSFIVGGLKISKEVTTQRVNDENFPIVYVGELFKYTIKLENISDTPAPSVTLSDVFPPEIDVVDYPKSSPYGSITYYPSSRTLIFYSPSLIKGTVTIPVTVRANSSITETKIVANSAKVEWNSPKRTETSNIVSVEVTPASDLQVGKTAGVTNVLSGQILTYTVSVTNTGSLSASEVVITDTIIDNLSLVRLIKDDLTSADIVTTTTRAVVKLDTPLIANQKVSFRIVAKVGTGLPTGSEVINKVEAIQAPWEIEGNYLNNFFTSTYTVTTITETGMQIKLSVSPKQAKIGESFTFKIQVTNTGNTKASAVKVMGDLPSILDYVSSTPDTGTVFTPITSGTSRSYNWTIGDLASNQTRTLVMVWKINSTATASVTHEHNATLNWDSSKNLKSNTVSFRVIGSSTLPETGLYQQQKDSSGLTKLAMIVGSVLGILGLSALIYGLWARRHKPLWANWFLVTGLILLGGGALFGAAAWGFSANPVKPVQELAAVDRNTPAPEQAVLVQPQATDFVEAFGAWPTPTPLTLPDYPIPTPPVSQDDGPLGNEPDPSAVTRIIIPKMGLDTVVKYVPYSNSTWLIGGLRQEIAWMGDTSWPGLGGNTGLAGHVDLANGDSGPFWNLAELAPGDHITLHTEKYKYTYTARETKVVPDTDLSVIQPTDNPQLTLITCIHWDPEFQMYLDRLVVFADLTKVEPLSQVSMSN